MTSQLKLFVLFVVCGVFSACAGSESFEGEWASGKPDALATPAPTKDPIPSPSPTPIAQPSTVDFALSSTLYSLAHDSAQIWNGCDSGASVKGGYNSDTTCGKAYLYPKFGEHLNHYFMSCVDQAAFDTGYSQPIRTFIKHFGSYNDRNARNSSSLSMHAYARALDIVAVRLFDVTGKLQVFDTNILFYKNSNAEFYDSFRACWKKTFSAFCKPGQSEYVGSIGHPDSELGGNTLHNDHIHLSYPFCAGQS